MSTGELDPYFVPNNTRTWWEVYHFITCEDRLHPRALIPIDHYRMNMDYVSKAYQNDP